MRMVLPAAQAWALFGLQLVPAFALYRGLFELTQSAFVGSYLGGKGPLTWSNLGSSGLAASMVVLALEWFLFPGAGAVP